MKKILLVATLILLFTGCNKKSPEQLAQEKLDEIHRNTMRQEIVSDSLLKVAMGIGGYKYMTQNRLNAIKELRKMFPGMKKEHDSLEICAIKME